MTYSFILIAATLAFEAVTNTCPISSTDELKTFRNGRKPELRVLDVTAQVISIGNPNASGYRPLTIEDANGRSELIYCGDDLVQGDVARFQGISRLNARLMPWDEPVKATIIENRKLPDPLVTTIDRIDARRDDLKTITTEGVVVSSFVDELDPRFWILIVKGNRSTLPVYILRDELPADGVDTDALIAFTGVFHRTINSWRQFQHPAVIADSIRILRPPRSDPFDVPEMDNVATLTVEEIVGLGRRRIDGRILAAWDDDRLMLKDRADRIYFARLQQGTKLPQIDDSVTLVGETDASIFNLTFENAIWKPAAPTDVREPEKPIDLNHNEYFQKALSAWKNLAAVSQGALVRISGTVLDYPSASDGGNLTINCGVHAVSVNLSALPEDFRRPEAGAQVQVTGRCLLETAKTTSYDIFPQITGIAVIVRSQSDLVVVSRPPWWTPNRLLIAIAALLVVLTVFIIWNRMLNHLVQKRGRELSRAEVARVSSELRVAERTRLAVELHDSLSQNLTGIALAVAAGEYEMAERSLKSCRRELKNCLWDLRSDALESSDMNDAIRRTLAPNLKGTRLNVRFHLARKTLSDTTTYAILRIVRELAVNAKRHGGATVINVAGSVEEKRILFSVRDNGTGFDPAKTPGVDQGHFGLQGIRERIRNMNGEMKIESSPQTGTKVSIWVEKPEC